MTSITPISDRDRELVTRLRRMASDTGMIIPGGKASATLLEAADAIEKARQQALEERAALMGALNQALAALDDCSRTQPVLDAIYRLRNLKESGQ